MFEREIRQQLFFEACAEMLPYFQSQVEGLVTQFRTENDEDPLPRECNILGFAKGLLNRVGFVAEISALMPEASEDDITDVHTISLAFLAAILLLDVIDGERITTDQLPPL